MEKYDPEMASIEGFRRNPAALGLCIKRSANSGAPPTGSSAWLLWRSYLQYHCPKCCGLHRRQEVKVMRLRAWSPVSDAAHGILPADRLSSPLLCARPVKVLKPIQFLGTNCEARLKTRGVP